MQFKLFAVSAAVSVVSADISTYWQSFTSNVNPSSVKVPTIDQTTSYDVVTECTYYTPDASLITINPAEWPSIWETATTNGMNTSAEFTAIYGGIDWTKAPSIPVRKVTADGGLDFTNYSATSDPDCWWSSSLCTTPKITDVNADIDHCPEPETFGLTYDDGPNCSHNAFYDYLSQQKLKASMFYIGSNIIDWPYGAMRGVADGHHIASHTWSHNYMTSLTNEEVLAELYYTQKAIKLTTGLTPKYWRPPYGDIDDRVRWIASQLGLTAVIWNLDTDDWAAGLTTTLQAVENTYKDFIAMGTNGTFATSGNIVLSHEINNDTMNLALEFLPQIVSSYKQVQDVATCASITNPYFEDFVFTTTTNTTSNATTSSTSTATGSSSEAAGASTAVASVKPASFGSSLAPNLALAILLCATVLFN